MIEQLKINRLRGIREACLEDLSPLVVLVGPNGCGKSTVLDAINIASSPNSAEAIARAVQRRQGAPPFWRWLLWRGDKGAKCSVQVNEYADPTGSRVVSIRQGTRLELNFQIEHRHGKGSTGIGESWIRFGPDGQVDTNSHPWPSGAAPEVTLVDAHSLVYQSPLHRLYTKAVEQGRRNQAKQMVAAVIPGVQDIEILTEEDRPIVHLVFTDHSVPAALAGDGIHSLLRLVLELASRRHGAVLLEEPEVHQHPGSIRQTARAILEAVRRDIQVIVTTHSLDLIDAVLSECEEGDLDKLSVYRLGLADGKLISTRVPGPDARFARTQIEDDLR